MKGKMFESEYEKACIELLQNEYWLYSHGETLHRKYSDVIIEDDLRQFLDWNYEDKGLSEDDYKVIIARIRNVGEATDYTSLRAAYSLYHNGFDYTYGDSSKQPFHLDYINYTDNSKNIFRAVNQFEVHQGNEIRIPDILLFVNGIPVGIIELKNPTDPKATIRDAHTQISVRYRRDIFSLLKYCALACISDGSNSRLGTVFTPYEFFYSWKKVNNTDQSSKGIDEMKSLIAGALSPERIVAILRDFVFFPDQTKDKTDESEIICRYPQFFATQLLRDNIITHLRSNGGDGKGGTYFGATGCGKTFTMLFLARQLAMRCKKQIGSPTILIIVDREDLESQAGKLFCKATDYMDDKSIKVFDSRDDLHDELITRETGGVYITTIQKFTSQTGLLSDRSNIICFSNEAHRSQNNTGSKLKINRTEEDGQKLGAFVTYGFAKYLRDALPNATYVGFTGTPVDETVHVFGDVVDKYTMTESQKDGITVPIKYEARLARVFTNTEQIQQIEAYYRLCADEGASEEEIKKSKAAMSRINVILSDPDRLKRLAVDILNHYDTMCEDTPDLVQKAMIVCSERTIAYKLYTIIKELRPAWCKLRKAMNENALSAEELEKLEPVSFVNVVATRAKDDDAEMYKLLGDKEHRKDLAEIFKNDKSNFKMAIVVDMWITGFDVPCLSVLYNDKPLQKHTLIQTISRVNRKYETKEYGLIVDYLGIRENMKQAMKQYGGGEQIGGDDIESTLTVFRNELQILKDMMCKFDFSSFFDGSPLERLQCLQFAAEYILGQPVRNEQKASFHTLYRGHVKRLKTAYNICNPAGVLEELETVWAQCLMGISSFLGKITDGQHDVESMNRQVEQMLKDVLNCSGVETILNTQTEEEIFGESFMQELDEVKLPNTKFQLLAKMLSKVIREYGRTNKIKAEYFKELLEKAVDSYNNRDNLTFTNDVTGDVVSAISDEVARKVESLTDQLLEIFQNLKSDKEEFKKLGITFEEKAFFDILVDTRNKHHFEYTDDQCIALAKKIKELIDGSSIYADWINNNNIRNGLKNELIKLLYHEGYPPQWNNEIFEKILTQVENYKQKQ